MASTYLERAKTGTDGNRQIWTISVWVKRSALGSEQKIFSFGENITSEGNLYFDANDFLVLQNDYQNGGTNETDMKFRDTSAWYHIVWACDSTQADNANRWKVYVNGTQVTLTGSPTITLNGNGVVNAWAAHDLWIGRTARVQNTGVPDAYLDASLAHVHFIDGTQYAASDFGQTDSASGIWKPKVSPSVTYGTNGFFLDFANSSDLGNDVSGNDNDFTLNGSGTQTLDTPSNVFATLNALDATSQTLTNGNTSSFNIANKTSISTLGFSAGKYYWEVKNVTQNVYTMLVGITNETNVASGILSSNLGSNANGWSYFIQNNADNGKAFNNNTPSSVYQTVSQGDIVSIAVDADTGKIWFGVNGTWVNSGNPANGTNAVFTNVSTSETLFPAFTAYNGSGGNPLLSFNFGNGYFGTTAVSTPESDSAGLGKFEYSVPSGYYALCTKNIADYG
jgi:hypothetical protein